MTGLSHFAFCGNAAPPAWGNPMTLFPENGLSLNRCRSRAFSLIEMLAVMAIIGIMLSLLLPAVGAFTSTAGRNGAVNTLMNVMEQARVAALESGRTVYIVFNRRIFPEQDQILVLRDPDPSLSTPESSNADYEALTRWIKMPKGILLHSLKKPDLDILSVSPASNFDVAKSPVPISLKPGEDYNVLAFNAYGAVSFPKSPKLMLFVSEGVRGEGGTEALISSQKERAGGYEIISLRRYTGRASLDVSTL